MFSVFGDGIVTKPGFLVYIPFMMQSFSGAVLLSMLSGLISAQLTFKILSHSLFATNIINLFGIQYRTSNKIVSVHDIQVNTTV